ncbi:MAG: cell division protein ZapA [Saprospiraceae bacterium]|nr:cell division protein ZapA [Saprospiraceae bacterium]MBK8670508.1 cell division protein ZapA [Saprospiraceae bacterium]MBL0101415.1 cell division protein ZapA [Saprospiraceae bacterium]
MHEDDLKTVKITIAGRNFPVKVTTEEEDTVRTLEVELNSKIMEFQSTYPSRDKLDCVIMTLLTYTFDQKNTSQPEDLKPVEDKIDAIKKVLADITLH